MNKETLNARADRLFALNKIITQLEPEVRSAAFLLLQGYVTAEGTSEAAKSSGNSGGSANEDITTFFSRFNTDTPAENVLLLAAYHFSQYGSSSFTVDELKSRASEIGLTLPERVDMTIRQARREGKGLFQSAGRGLFKPTVHGELFLRTTYQVAKGTHQKASSE
jgi:hypothetical protein